MYNGPIEAITELVADHGVSGAADFLGINSAHISNVKTRGVSRVLRRALEEKGLVRPQKKYTVRAWRTSDPARSALLDRKLAELGYPHVRALVDAILDGDVWLIDPIRIVNWETGSGEVVITRPQRWTAETITDLLDERGQLELRGEE